MAVPFKKGDVVQLKSGGPRMTVEAVFPDGDVRVAWFAGSKLEIKVIHSGSIDLWVDPAGENRRT
jgi:uncharacterized protein YodC (DUF2158 family)